MTDETYIDRQRRLSDELRDEVRPIAEAMGWDMLPAAHDRDGVPLVGVTLQQPSGPLQIHARSLWNEGDRLTFTAASWPVYQDMNGQTKRVTPYDVRGTATPQTKAAKGRDAAQVAAQVARRVIEPYAELYETLAERAKAEADYADRRNRNRLALLNATGEPPTKANGEINHPYHVQGVAGFVRVEMRGEDDVSLTGLTTAEAIVCIETIRAMRAEDEAA